MFYIKIANFEIQGMNLICASFKRYYKIFNIYCVIVKILPDPQYGAEAETVRLTCDAFAIPKPESLLWSAHGYPITVIMPFNQI